MTLRINVGCGATPTPGWLNFDNSPTIWLGRFPLMARALRRVGVLDQAQASFAAFCASHDISFADALHLPLDNSSVAVLYSSHMLEHFDPDTARAFLNEAMRVLRPGGVLRLAVPDLRPRVQSYIEDQDADKLIAGMLVCAPAPRSFVSRIKLAIQGPRHHLWMYDSRSLSALLLANGFVNVVPLPAGQTGIGDPGELNLREREDESLYVEATRPGAAKPATGLND